MSELDLRVGEREVRLESGAVARQAGGAVLLTSGRLVLLAAATADAAPTRLSYMPLTTEYRLRHSAAGRIPGGYDRREARPTEPETLTSRLIDRSIRPFFPEAWSHDTQVIVQPLSHDPAEDAAVLGITAAAAALALSDVPWAGPVAGVRIGLRDGRPAVLSDPREAADGELDLVVSCSRDGIVMVEGGAREVPEDLVHEAFSLALATARPVVDALDALAEGGRPKRPTPERRAASEQVERVREQGRPRLEAALALADKRERYRALDEAVDSLVGELDDQDRADARAALGDLKAELVREGVLEGRRIGGRGPEDVRPIGGRAGWLPSCHGSSLFTRGETQAIVTCTLGFGRDAKSVETLDGELRERFLLHYNFPPYCVGEVKPLRGPGRREVGHGHLARRALLPVLPSEDEAPYTIRLESLITESNGSSSMATVCGGTLALLDAGLPIARPVAGIAMGLVQEGERHVVLSDILGDEDHVGDMDFKVCGTERGVTAIQLDNKLGSLPEAVMREALDQAREGRLLILGEMAKVLGAPRTALAPHAPRAVTLAIEPSRIGSLVGPGGKTIRALEEELSVKIEIEPSGRVRVYGTSAEGVGRARTRVHDLTGIPRLDEVVSGVVVAVQPFGSFVRLYEGIEGLLPDERLEVNQRLSVRCRGVNARGKIELVRA
jgi:polyribonucleotide nucleotidyltransferase